MPLIPEAQQIIPPEPDGDTTLAPRTMGAGNRTVLPEPLLGHFDIEDLPTVSFTGGGTLDELRELGAAVLEVATYAPGRYTFLVPSGKEWTVEVGKVRKILLNAQIADDSPTTLFDTLLNRLQIDADEIRVPIALGTIPLVGSLSAHGFVNEPDEPVTATSVADPTTPPSEMVWRRP